MPHPFAVVLVGLLAMVWLAPWPILTSTVARLVGDTSVSVFVIGTEDWAHRTLFLTLFLAVAAGLWSSDRWLAGITAMAGLHTFIGGPKVISAYFLLGVGALLVGRYLPAAWRPRALDIVAGFGIAQAVLVLVQWMNWWTPWNTMKAEPFGSIGIFGIAACYLVLLGLLAPWWGLVFVAPAIAVTSVRTALLALAVGIGLRYGPVAPRIVWPMALLLAIVAAWLVSTHPAAFAPRAEIWKARLTMLVREPVARWTGFGMGAWQNAHIASTEADQVNRGTVAQPEIVRSTLRAAHNDLVQWTYDTGAIGFVLLAGWLIRWRRLFLFPRVGPALAGLAVMSLAWWPLHDLRTSLLTALLAGVATSPLTEGA